MLLQRISRRLPGAAVLLLTTSLSAGDTIKQECLSGYEQAQRLRQDSRLREAREQALLCAREGCPAEIRKDCSQWFPELEKQIPSVIIDAKGPDGKDLAEVRVLFDGKLLLERLDWRAVNVDPGSHVLRYEPAQGQPVEERVLLREAEKGRRLSVRFGGPTPAAPGPAVPSATPQVPQANQRTTSPLVWVGFGVGGVGLVLGSVTGLMSLTQTKDLKDKCGGDLCPPQYDSDMSTAKTLGWTSNIAFGVGVVGVGVGVLGLLVAGEPAKAVGAPTTPRVAPVVGLQEIGVRGTF